MQVSFTEEDLRTIWRDLYTEAARKGYGHKSAAEHADHFVNAILADMTRAVADMQARMAPPLAAVVAAQPPTAIPTRTAEDERRDVLAFMTAEWEALLVSEVEDDDIATRRDARRAELRYLIRVFTSGEHIGAAGRTEVKP